jgi:hypothetical protein
MHNIRKIPPVCLFVALTKLLVGRLKLHRNNIGLNVSTGNADKYAIFRHISVFPIHHSKDNCVFTVSFKFARLTHKANKIASIIPMLLIAGYPGFMQKIYALNPKNGYWQGMYQWKSITHLEAYKKSFVFRMMNKRALIGSVQLDMVKNYQLDKLLNDDAN